MYDNVCKFLADAFPEDLVTWLLGYPLTMSQLRPSELSLEPVWADSLILLNSDPLILHIEFQTQPDRQIPFRMADYRLRSYRKYPDKEMHQVVVYLKPTSSPLVQETVFRLSKTYHEFQVIRLWEQPTEAFLSNPGLLPFACLSDTANPVEVLTQVARATQTMVDRQTRSNLTGCAAVLAGLVLDKETIRTVFRRETMRESVIYQDILQEGLEEGRQEGRQQVAVNMLREGMDLEFVARVTGLPLEQVQQLQNNWENGSTENESKQINDRPLP